MAILPITSFVFLLLSTLLFLFSYYIIDYYLTERPEDWIVQITNFSSSTTSIFTISTHFFAGVTVMILSPIQLLPFLRSSKFLKLHKLIGRVIVFASMLLSIAGLSYIILIGTAGGLSMDISFSIYGILMFFTSAMTIKHAINGKITEHRAMALRLFSLIIGSGLYRLLLIPLLLKYHGNGNYDDDEDRSAVITYLNVAAWFFYFPSLAIMETYIYLIKPKQAPQEEFSQVKKERI